MTVTSSAAVFFSGFAIPQIPSATDIAHSAVSNAMIGLDRFIAYPPVEKRVGELVHDLAVATQPEHWIFQPARPSLLNRLEKGEYIARHVAFSLFIAPLLGGFLYDSNPSGIRLTASDLKTMLRRYFELLERDAANVDRVYPRNVLKVAFGDLDGREVMQATYETRHKMMEFIRRREGYIADRPNFDASKWPSYFLNLFHWRDWFDPSSALSWDTMTELLFAGLYGAMQRAALPPTLDAVRRICGRRPEVVELGAGTGTFANYLLETLQWHRRPEIGLGFIEMSPVNMALARRRLARWKDAVSFFDYERDGACAEKIPYGDGAVDVTVSINLFHELPPHIRRQAASEIGRVLRPGGRLVFFDSVQKGDGVDSLLAAFGESGHHKEARTGTFHEPYIPGYAEEDLADLFGAAGLRRIGDVAYAYLAKGLTFEKI